MNTHSKTGAAGTRKSLAQTARQDALTATPRRRGQLLLGAMALAAGTYAFGVNTAAAGPKYWLEYSFLGAPTDGEVPVNTLAWGPNGQNANWLYGITQSGGSGSCSLYSFTGCGTVSGLTPASYPNLGAQDWVGSLSLASGNGADPQALVDVGGTLYGVTAFGGTGNNGDGGGTLFSQPASGGQPTVLYNFCSAPRCVDGETPTALINVNGTLYGTTKIGGAYGYGMVFSVNLPNTTPTVLYSFQVPATNGENPTALTYDSASNALYGATGGGGPHGGGVVYSLPIPCNACTDTPLYNFCGRASCADGRVPNSVYYDNANNMLYGTTLVGGGQGGSACDNDGCGTVFSLNMSGIEVVMHAFCSAANCTDGIYPNGLDPDGLDANGTTGSLTPLGNGHNKLYGTTFTDGTPACAAENFQYACGTLFQIKLNGRFTVEHDFPANGADGTNPNGPLVNVNGTLYGVTYMGGVSNWGTVFAYKP